MQQTDFPKETNKELISHFTYQPLVSLSLICAVLPTY